MARFEVTGLDDLIADMKRMHELSGDIADEMLLAGAEEVKGAWKETAEKFQFKETGDMIESIGYPIAPKTVGDVRRIDIYPQGKGSSGVRNAEKAFILHYGTQGSTSANAIRKRKKVDKRKGPGIPATHWVDEADDISGPRVMEAMEEIWNKHIMEGN